MKWPTKLFFAIAIAAAISLIAVVSRQRMRTPREVLEEVRAALQNDVYDQQALLRRLDSSLRKAESGDLLLPAVRETCADLRLTRGRLLLDIGSTDGARADFEYVLENYRPEDRETRRLLIDAETAEGQLESALVHLNELLEDEPTFAPAWIQSGALHQALAEQFLTQCEEKLRYALIENDSQRANDVLRELAARDPLDPARVNALLELRKLFSGTSEELLGQVLALAEEASVHLTECRRVLLQSFAIELDGDALRRYLVILEAAGRHPNALALGSLVALQGPYKADPESAELIIRMLMERGDYAHASDLASVWINHREPLGAKFLRLECEALYRGNSLANLNRAASRLRSIGSPDDENLFQFYAGLLHAKAAEPRIDTGIQFLTRFARSRTPDPFEGARVIAWREVARLYQLKGDLSGEREAIQAALALDPEDAGELWLRRAELQGEMPHGGYALPLESWAMGMSLLPHRAEELMPRFIELGEQRLTAEERSIQVIYEDMRLVGRSAPERELGPYVLYRIAQLHGERSEPISQGRVAKRLLEQLPGFVPALDQQIESRWSLGDREPYIELVLARIELTGLTNRARELLDTVLLSELDAQQTVRLMRANPRGSGRRIVAEWLKNNGENVAALETLESAPQNSRTDEENLLGAQILYDAGKAQSAKRWLSMIADTSPLASRRYQLAVSCALQAGTDENVIAAVIEYFEHSAPRPTEILALVDELILDGRAEIAGDVLARCKVESLPNPGSYLLRELQLALLAGEYDAAEEAVERAGAFLPESDYLVARLLLHTERGEWLQVAEITAEWLESSDVEDPQKMALASLLAGDYEAALEPATAALVLTPQEPRWIAIEAIAKLALGQEPVLPAELGRRAGVELRPFLLGDADEPRDPREVAALLLASRDPRAAPWAAAHLNERRESRLGITWSVLFTAELFEAAGDTKRASQLYRVLVKLAPDWLRGWDKLERLQVETFGSPLHPQVERVRQGRIAALAKADPESAAGQLLLARDRRAEGDLNVALRQVLRAQSLAPDWYETSEAVAKLYTELGVWDAALDEWRALVANADELNDLRARAGFIEALERAARSDPPAVPLETLKLELDALNSRWPGDPSCVLALSRLDLRLDKGNPAYGLERAWTRLRSLREDIEQEPLESLQRGATAKWARFYVDTDPTSAETFILDELGRQPGNLELWLLLGRVQRELGDFKTAYDTLTRVSMMAPSASVQMELARTYVAQGAAPRFVERAIRQVERLSGGALSLEGRLLRAQSYIDDLKPQSLEAGLAELQRLWEERHQLEDLETRVQLAGLYARALIMHEAEGDDQRAIEALESELENAPAPYVREYFDGLLGIARSRIAVRE